MYKYAFPQSPLQIWFRKILDHFATYHKAGGSRHKGTRGKRVSNSPDGQFLAIDHLEMLDAFTCR